MLDTVCFYLSCCCLHLSVHVVTTGNHGKKQPVCAAHVQHLITNTMWGRVLQHSRSSSFNVNLWFVCSVSFPSSDECWMKGLSASNWGCDYHLNTLDRFPCFPNLCYCFITVLTRSSLIRVAWRPDRAGHPSHDAALVRAERDSGSVSVPVRCDRNGALCLRSRSRPYYEHTPWYHGTRHKLSPCSRAALDSSCIVFKSTHTHLWSFLCFMVWAAHLLLGKVCVCALWTADVLMCF